MDARHDGAGGVRLLVSPTRDEKHAYTTNEARAIAAMIVDAAQEADEWRAAVAHQAAVNAPNPHAAAVEPDETAPVAPAKPRKRRKT